MSVQLVGGTSGVAAEVDAASKALRVTLYDSSGAEVDSPPTGSYMLAINIRHTAISPANAPVWGFRNGATKTCYIRRIMVTMGFDGTPAATTTVRYDWKRFSGANLAAGASILTSIVKKRNSYASSSVADARQQFTDTTGLTVVGVTQEASFMTFSLPLFMGTPGVGPSLPVNRDIVFEKPMERFDCFELAPNEGLLISMNVAAVVGQSLVGFIAWDER